MEYQQPTSEEMNLADYLALALRRKWIILSTFVIVFSITAYYIFSSPNQYRSASTFIVESKNMSGIGADLVFDKGTRPFGFYEKVLSSSAFHDMVIQLVQSDTILATIENGTGFVHQDFFDKYLTIAQTDYEDLIELKVKAYDPEIAYRMAEIATEAFKKRCQAIELEESHNIVDFVNMQIEQARQNLEQAERDLQVFEKKTKINTNFSKGGILERLAEIENELAEIESQRRLTQANLASYQKRLEQIKDVQSTSIWDIESSETVQLKDEINAIETRKNTAIEKYGLKSSAVAVIDKQLEAKKHELVQVILNTEQPGSETKGETAMTAFNERVVSEELNLYTLQNREKYLKGLISQYRAKYPNLLENNIELAQLQRSKKVNENLYNFLIEKAEEAKINAATGTGGIRIVDAPALPESPIGKNKARNLLVGFILGFGLGFGIAFVVDYFDNAIYTPDDLKKLGDPNVLGSIPLIKVTESPKKKKFSRPKSELQDMSVFEGRMNGYRNRVISMSHAKEPVSDAYRQIRTNLQFSSVDSRLNEFVVTSAIPAEGKTLTASNLAISFAEMGKRVLVVDCDLRRSHQHIIFNIRKSPGLSNFLAGQSDLEKVIYLTSVPNLYVVPAGSTPPNPAEMLASDRMQNLVKRLRGTFDIIIYDTPPVISVTDPILLARFVQNIVMVLRYGQTSKHLVEDAMERLKKAQCQLTGIILNGMQNKRGYGYYKYDYHYYQKSYYTDESPSSGFSKKTTILN